MAAAATELRTVIRDALDAEFASDGLTFDDDRLSGAVAHDRPRAGVYPGSEVEGRDGLVQEVEVRIQIFQQWDKEIDPEQSVSPAGIESWAERAKRALQAVNSPATEKTWFFRVTRTEYLPDPTGNITRAELVVRSFGENTGLLETGA